MPVSILHFVTFLFYSQTLNNELLIAKTICLPFIGSPGLLIRIYFGQNAISLLQNCILYVIVPSVLAKGIKI